MVVEVAVWVGVGRGCMKGEKDLVASFITGVLPALLCLAACLLSMSVCRCRRRSTQERGPFSCLCDVFRPTSPDKHARNLASSEYDKEQQAAAVASRFV